MSAGFVWAYIGFSHLPIAATPTARPSCRAKVHPKFSILRPVPVLVVVVVVFGCVSSVRGYRISARPRTHGVPHVHGWPHAHSSDGIVMSAQPPERPVVPNWRGAYRLMAKNNVGDKFHHFWCLFGSLRENRRDRRSIQSFILLHLIAKRNW
jgi:hypothetical protein